MGKRKATKEAKEPHSEEEEEQSEQGSPETSAQPAPQNPPSDEANDSDETPQIESGPSKRSPLVIEYCPVCTFPFEFCEYSGKLDECRPHLIEFYKRKAVASDPDNATKLEELSFEELEDKVKKKKESN
eukprot:NODE_4279_length_812_cov_25.627737_g4121_i0.p1 GENE.NODE_4279_length_812_cov_25.627737_g4121_i0~~NODE_4279_length_812_cov_25.627737_g4121_i0.p1  ORF type:complete len:129 (+),score=26.04 NODE_4279_length_812_cov_25.627737_g4121_i0:35-421(+)